MAPKASISLPDGTKIEIDGSLEELQALTQQLHSRGAVAAQPRSAQPAAAASQRVQEGADDDGSEEPDFVRIVAVIRECDEAEAIEKNILDKRDVLNRVLLPLWIVQKYINQSIGLTSGDVEKITDQLGVKVAIAHASTTLSDKAKSYVTGDSVRRKGGTVHYRLNRRGVQFFEAVIAGN